MKKIYLILCFLFISGCASEAEFQRILNTRLGLTPKQLIQNIGIPAQTYQLDQTQYYVYKYSSSVYIPQQYMTHFNNYGSYGTAHTNSFGGYNMHYYCEVTYTIEDGVVKNWTYNGNNCRL